ncbi:serine hydrolase [Streptomonospora nanhaiensis]|uniref:Beta-lactamase class A n=1 Tax=Streptomonospora nanhaiensis TaxID=1323731 RepID=A0A853BND3_9ACTN|nr:serine hydrolase [Streptomonospora nanhaiensis]NYI95962.1 beta-lactamase class A [Streptomonospora nanhaiensis]
MSIQERLAAVFAETGVTAKLHARDLDGGGEIAWHADDQVVIASIFKVLLVLEFARQAHAGQLDPAERVVVGAADRLGGWGTAGYADDVEMSLRDLAYSAIQVSDNTAADVLLRRVGLDTVRLLAAELGLERTRIIGGPRQVLEMMLADVGARDYREFARVFPTLPEERMRRLRVFDPDRTTSSTARDITRLLELVWRDAAGPAPACAAVRGFLAQQIFWTRIASGFPPAVRVSAKTGTLPGLHMEAGVAEYPDGGRYAVAVFAATPTVKSDARRLDVDLAIGRAARTAVEELRSVSGRAPAA